ncbi:Hypothetical predicted protein, partial [Paramuricea clavata]
MAECKEPCENEIDAVLEPLHSDALDREEELQHAFEEAIEEMTDGEFCCNFCGKKCRSNA